MKYLKGYLVLVLVATLLGGWFPCITYYQDEKYEEAFGKYTLEKEHYDIEEKERVYSKKDSLEKSWYATHDTTLRKVNKIKKEAIYSADGYYRKNGKFRCKKEKYGDDLICEPDKEFVTTDYYISGYRSDTTWLPGYKDKSDWIKERDTFISRQMKDMHKEYKPYDGPEFHYIIKEASFLYTFGYLETFIVIVVFVIITFISLANFSVIKEEGWIKFLNSL